MNENYKISVIVTVHNSEKYLEKCLKSICTQTFQDIEILCIDGKSRDSSPEILLAYKEKDSRIRIINDSNVSYGHKINIGIEQATGKYISILESDDQYAPTMLESLYKIIEKYKLDYVDSDFYEFWEVNGKLFHYKRNKYKNKDYYNTVISASKNNELIISTGAIWTGLYNRDFLVNQGIKLNESIGASFQDTSFGFQVGVLAERSYHLSEPLHYYRIDNAGSSVKDAGKTFEIAYEIEYLKKCLTKKNLNQKVWELYYRTKYYIFFWNACRLSGNSREEFLHLYVNELKKDIMNNYIQKSSLTVDDYRVTYLALESYQEFKKLLSESPESTNYSDSIYNMVTLIGKMDIVIFGGGLYGKQIIDLYCDREEQIKCICDNSKELQGTRIGNHNVLSVSNAVKMYPMAVYIIANSRHKKEMKCQLIELGISNERIYTYKEIM